VRTLRIDVEITRFTKYKVAKEILLERTPKFQENLNQTTEITQKIWDKVFETITGTDKPTTLEGKRKSMSLP
jgi:hypothetical protein